MTAWVEGAEDMLMPTANTMADSVLLNLSNYKPSRLACGFPPLEPTGTAAVKPIRPVRPAEP